jgi:hypothetical protein
MLATFFNCCTCKFGSDECDDFDELHGMLHCIQCYDNPEIVMKCEDCGYKSSNYYDFKSIATSDYTDKDVCLNCLGESRCCGGRGCRTCLT